MKIFFSEVGAVNLKVMENIRRGWIVPVGGATPDRLKGGLCFPADAGVDRSGRGCNPRPALLPTGSAEMDLI